MLRQAILHLVMGLGGEDVKDTKARIAAYEAEHGRSHRRAACGGDCGGAADRSLQTTRTCNRLMERLANGMSVNGHGCAHRLQTRFYGSTAPNNPHPYPWMNSLFQDGVTVGWLMGESYHRRSSAPLRLPERLADILLTREFERDQRGRVLPLHALH